MSSYTEGSISASSTAAHPAPNGAAEPATAHETLWAEVFDLEDVLGRAYDMAHAADALATALREGDHPHPKIAAVGLAATTTALLEDLHDVRERYFRVFAATKAVRRAAGHG